ncbi:hypothetical protein [Bacillus pumilus]|nr:hypothetical protein [Bacillus pumilus]
MCELRGLLVLVEREMNLMDWERMLRIEGMERLLKDRVVVVKDDGWWRKM